MTDSELIASIGAIGVSGASALAWVARQYQALVERLLSELEQRRKTDIELTIALQSLIQAVREQGSRHDRAD